ncbi:MAG TPA: chemotaxis protein CheW [Gallionellaceae bacterium]|nr:chemotaxis protein CheW [Gallionellaceae bacterium]
MAKRFNLRAFQQDVLDRLQQQAATGDRITTLGLQVGNQRMLVDMADISEVLELPQLTVVPLTKSWYRGVANVRGNIYGVVDMAAYLNQGETVQDANNRVLLLGQKFAFNAGLLVNRVLGLRNASGWQSSEQDGVVHYQDAEGQSWLKLDIKQLLQQPEFLQIGA